MSGNWDVFQLQDLDGYWVIVECDGSTAEKHGPFATKEDAHREEIQARMRIRLAHGPGALGS